MKCIPYSKFTKIIFENFTINHLPFYTKGTFNFLRNGQENFFSAYLENTYYRPTCRFW